MEIDKKKYEEYVKRITPKPLFLGGLLLMSVILWEKPFLRVA